MTPEERSLLHHLPQGHSSAYRTETDVLGGIRYTQHGDSFPGDDTEVLHRLGGVLLAVVFGDHAEAGGAAFHGVGLLDVGKSHSVFISNVSTDTIRLLPPRLLYSRISTC